MNTFIEKGKVKSNELRREVFFEVINTDKVEWSEIEEVVMRFVSLTLEEYVPGLSLTDLPQLGSETFKDLTSRKGAFLVYIRSVKTGEIIGMATCHPYLGMPNDFYLPCICLTKENRKEGKVKFLMDKVIMQLKKRGARTLTMDALNVQDERGKSFATRLEENYSKRLLSSDEREWRGDYKVPQKRITIRI